MSQITCCPTCRTLFKVEPEQLKVSDGWVRCGHCDGVFDASAHFQVIAEPVDKSEVQKFLPSGPVASDLATGGVDSAAAPEGFAPTDLPFAPLNTPESSGSPAALASYLAAQGASQVQSNPLGSSSRHDTEARRALYGRESSSSINPEESAQRPRAIQKSAYNAKQRSRRSRPWYRALAVVVLFFVMGVLLAQALVHERQSLASEYPPLRPVLQALCQRLDCQINPPRTLEAIIIDSSSLTQIAPDTYRLDFVLKNSKGGGVAMPALEVLLTGAQDEALGRKIVLPSEFGAASAWLDKGVSFSGTFNVMTGQLSAVNAAVAVGGAPMDAPLVAAMSPSTPITGYRLLVFYP